MTVSRRISGLRNSAVLADWMADAVTYLSRVADEAGMDEISADLLSICKRLAEGGQHGAPTAAVRQKKRALRRSK